MHEGSPDTEAPQPKGLLLPGPKQVESEPGARQRASLGGAVKNLPAGVGDRSFDT